MTHPVQLSSAQRGAALMEALVAMLIVAFGVLGFIGLQARTAVSNLEAYQRAQALVLLNDMAQRMNVNRNASKATHPTNPAFDYLADDIGTGSAQNCSALTGAASDLCEWGNLLRGAAEKDNASNNVGAMLGARGCISQPTGFASNEYLIAVVWQGIQATGATPLACGANQYGNENLRRGASLVVRIGNLGV